MLRLVKKSRLVPEEAIKRALEFFGPKGYGLTVSQQSHGCATFEGAGGAVEITTCAEGKGSSVEVVSREWDEQAKEFLNKLG